MGDAQAIMIEAKTAFGWARAMRVARAQQWVTDAVVQRMSKLIFTPNSEPTLGVNWNSPLWTGQTMALSSSIGEILERVPPHLEASIKPELMQCYLEINTGICRTVKEAEADLRHKIEAVEGITDELGLRLLWTGTHPFSCGATRKSCRPNATKCCWGCCKKPPGNSLPSGCTSCRR
jgi:hypothetical protein